MVERSQRFVEFWDSRACERAHDELMGGEMCGGRLDLKFSWDTGMVPSKSVSLPPFRSNARRLSGESRRGPGGQQPMDGGFRRPDASRFGNGEVLILASTQCD